MFVRLLLIILTIICIAMGFHYVKREFGVGPGLPDLTDYFATLQPQSTVTPSPSMGPATANDNITIGSNQLGSLLAVPLIIDANGIASNSVSLSYLEELQPFMVVLFGKDIPATAAASVTEQLRQLPQPPVIAVDHEGGLVQRLTGAGFTSLPSWQQLCALNASERSALIASSAAQLKQVGVDVVLGPDIDLTASGSALRTRTCSSDPNRVAVMAKEVIEVYQAAGITSMIKHYPGIGSARTDLHTSSAKVVLTPTDAQPFEILLLDQPTLAVMISHLRVDPADPQTPCSLSYVCVGELHRVFPDALLVSDALEMNSAGFLASSSAQLRPLPERATTALRVGIDLLLFGPSVTEAQLRLVNQQLQSEFVFTTGVSAKVSEHIRRNRTWRSSLPQ